MKKLLVGLALTVAAASANADSLIYGGASVGQSNYKGDQGMTYSAHVGTGILPFIGIEGGMTRFESLNTAPGEETEANTVYVALKPSIDVGPLRVYATGGAHKWDEKVNGVKVDDGVDLTYGIGVEYYIMGPITIGASYQVYEMDGDNLGTFMLNGTFNFL